MNLTAEAQAFLERFFGPGNEIRWEQIAGGRINPQAVEDLLTWIDELNGFNRPVLLPRGREGGLVQWYAIAFSSQQARALREDLMAFVGPTWTLFTGRTATLDANDPVEAAILDLHGQTTFRIDIPSRDHFAEVRANLMQMRRVWDQRPLQGRSSVRPTGRIIRDFEFALQSGSFKLADRCIAELRSGGRLSAQNVTFLKVRSLAASGSWGELLALPEIPDLLQIRRPTLVTQALLEAVYIQLIAPLEKKGMSREALDVFRDEVLPRWSPLFRARGSIRSPHASKAFILLAAAADPPRPELRDAVLADFPIDAEGRIFAEALAALVAETPPESLDSLALARKAFSSSDFDEAYKQLLACSAGRETLQMLLTTALQLGTLEAARSAIERMNAAPAALSDVVLSLRTCRRDWAELQGLAGSSPNAGEEAIPGGWMEWIKRMAQGPWPEGVEVAAMGRLEWDVTEYQQNPQQLSKFCRYLEAVSASSGEFLRFAVPHLLAAFIPEGRSTAAFKPLYLSLLTNLALDEGIGRESFEIMQELTIAILNGDHTADNYREVIEYLVCAWKRLESPRMLDSALDMLDQLVALPCRDGKARLDYWSAVTDTISKHIRRIELPDWTLYRMVSQDLGLGQNAESLYDNWIQARPNSGGETVDGVEAPDLSGKTIALYTLTESMARRAKELLERTYPGVGVQLNSDHVATDQLATMARNADYFIVDSRSAKHAATNSIKDNRPPNKPILYPAGKGVSSLLRAVYGHLATLR